jgi:glycosyltransferase involved in cell wall biosynthesis
MVENSLSIYMGTSKKLILDMIEKELNRKQRLLIFHPALAPYRIDQFNLLNELFDFKVVFLMENLLNFNMDQQKLREVCQFEFSFLLKGMLFKRRLFRFGMLREIKKTNPDIIMGFEYSLTTQYLLLLKKAGIISAEIGSFIDDSPDICKNVQSKVRKWIRKRSVKKLDFMVVMSREVAHFYINNFSLNEKNVLISPILQLPERLREDSMTIERYANKYMEEYQLIGKKIILFVGRLVPEKALSLFIEIIAPYLQSNANVRFILVGDGSEEERLKTIVKENSLESKILLVGKYQAKELYGWYACASGFVLPSVSETFGAVVNEALIFGLKVFCSSNAGASSLINYKNGILFNPLDRADTYDKFQQYIKDLKPVENISLDNSPPLIEDYRPFFRDEWKKLFHSETIMPISIASIYEKQL